MKTTATKQQLESALDYVNELYDGNVMFRYVEQLSKNRVKFTLRTKDSRGPGSRIGYTGRRMPCACWHVHGHFFEFLFKNYTGVKIWSQGRIMESNADNWMDRNIGSMIRPMYFSKACECRKENKFAYLK